MSLVITPTPYPYWQKKEVYSLAIWIPHFLPFPENHMKLWSILKLCLRFVQQQLGKRRINKKLLWIIPCTFRNNLGCVCVWKRISLWITVWNGNLKLYQYFSVKYCISSAQLTGYLWLPDSAAVLVTCVINGEICPGAHVICKPPNSDFSLSSPQ